MSQSATEKRSPNTQIKTLTVKLSDAEIGRNAKLEHVRDLRDAGHPALHFRFNKNRARGSWYLLNKRQWHRIGAYPDLNTKQVIAALPAVRLRVVGEGQRLRTDRARRQRRLHRPGAGQR